ncbi:MAG: SulP family inorganic anion transporter, partial [Rubrivivax sp.]|nr:SulP family inorganic anion transporter [Rubrivivax sp.]
MSNGAGHRPALRRLFPFLNWFPVTMPVLRGDALAGVTGALVLVPKAMAYAHLSGLPVHYGLYVAFVPAILGAMWGSSQQLATGPVAVLSLMTAAALAPLALPFSADYIALALLLSLLVGLIQLALGALKLGTIVSFVSHPVILGFMNAAAVLIALSQIDMLLGIPKGRSDVFLVDVWDMLGHLPQTHLPTLAMSAFALVLMLALRRVARVSRLSVLIAVVVTILASAAIDFERNTQALPDRIADADTRDLVKAYVDADQRLQVLAANAPVRGALMRSLEPVDARAAAVLRHQIHLEQIDAAVLKAENKERLRYISGLAFERGAEGEGGAMLYVIGAPDEVATDGGRWRIRKIEGGELRLAGGGEVVGQVPRGLPAFKVPTISFDTVLSLLSAAVVIALVAFMESIAMAKAIAAKTRQAIDPNQELIGQGVANIGGSFFQSYPACGSFTGSAINLQAGARTGMAMVFNGLFVVVTLLLLTPLLYHLPKATLAVVILLAVSGL